MCAIDILSEYTDTISNFMLLQDDPPWWLPNRESSRGGQLFSRNNFYSSANTTDDISDRQRVNFLQEVASNVHHSALQKAQKGINNLLPKETDHFELSVYCSCPPTKEDKNTIEASVKKGDKSSETICAEHINEVMIIKKSSFQKLHYALVAFLAAI